MKPIIHRCDFLVIGGGIAGLRAAIGASRFGSVTILNKGLKGESNSKVAQGGIAAALDGAPDEIESHFEDTIAAGRGLCKEDAVRILVSEAPRRLKELLDWGVLFDQKNGKFILAREGAHSRNRILRARGDATGNEIVRTLKEAIASNDQIQTLDGYFSMDLLMQGQGEDENARCHGAWALNESDGSLHCFAAKAVILATGGVGRIFKRTTNPPVATGDGIAMALRAGAALEDMEFFQFHPTALAKEGAPSFLLSETIRGEGGRLRTAEGKLFMDRYHPDAELAPRDLVSRAILSEIEASGSDHVFLDLRHLDPHFVRERFPMIYATCLHYRIDMTEQAIPVAPSAHYLMGGIQTDLFGRTTISGLYAVGEVASTGVHGANRLASNSLLEGLVFGARVGDVMECDNMAEPLDDVDIKSLSPKGVEENSSSFDVDRVQAEIQSMMWQHAGMIRSQKSLEEAIDIWHQWRHLPQQCFRSRREIETQNMLLTAAALISTALMRAQSIGAHFREDFPALSEQEVYAHSCLKRSDLKRDFAIE